MPTPNTIRVQLVNKPTSPRTGIGRYAMEIERGLREHGVNLRIASLRNPIPRTASSVGRRAGLDLETFFRSYPVRVDAQPGYVTHLTSQTLGLLLLTQRLPRPIVVTVHDILPYMLRHDPELNVYRTSAHRLFDALAMRGLERADRLIAVSRYTKSTVANTLRIRADMIDVIHESVDTERFRPQPVTDSFRERYHLLLGRQYVLYVGSEDPRKNLPLLLRAMKQVREAMPNAVLLKVGAAAFADQRQHHLRICSELNISDSVQWLDEVPEDDLPLFYNIATVFALLSLEEGFGLPLLEAMACGTPVVASNRGALPEVVGSAGVIVDPTDPNVIASAIRTILIDSNRVAMYSKTGLHHAECFTIDEETDATLSVYNEANHGIGASMTRRSVNPRWNTHRE